MGFQLLFDNRIGFTIIIKRKDTMMQTKDNDTTNNNTYSLSDSGPLHSYHTADNLLRHKDVYKNTVPQSAPQAHSVDTALLRSTVASPPTASTADPPLSWKCATLASTA